MQRNIDRFVRKTTEGKDNTKESYDEKEKGATQPSDRAGTGLLRLLGTRSRVSTQAQSGTHALASGSAKQATYSAALRSRLEPIRAQGVPAPRQPLLDSSYLPQHVSATACDADDGVMVLGDRSKRAAAKRAGIDRQRLEAMRNVRQRTAAEEPRRFNHYDDGAGSWDCDTIGIEGGDDCDLRWEGLGSTAVGPRL